MVADHQSRPTSRRSKRILWASHVRTTTRIALDRERQLAQRHEQVRRPRPQRDHRGLGIDRPLRGIDAPAARRPMSRDNLDEKGRRQSEFEAAAGSEVMIDLSR
jgi:hypothetical protein